MRADWDAGTRLRGWVARTDDMDAALQGRERVFGEKVSLPWTDPSFEFAIPTDGSLPLDGAMSALYRELAIDRPPDVVQGKALRYRASIDTPGGVRELR